MHRCQDFAYCVKGIIFSSLFKGDWLDYRLLNLFWLYFESHKLEQGFAFSVFIPSSRCLSFMNTAPDVDHFPKNRLLQVRCFPDVFNKDEWFSIQKCAKAMKKYIAPCQLVLQLLPRRQRELRSLLTTQRHLADPPDDEQPLKVEVIVYCCEVWNGEKCVK